MADEEKSTGSPADAASQGTDAGAQDAGGPQLVLQKIYLKDLSFESPKAPDIFTANISPQTQLNLRYENKDLGQDNVEVTLTITVEAKHEDTTVFLVELAQAGVFLVRGYQADQKASIVGSFCPNTLYPFAREAIADLIQRGGFPQLLLQPINFDALYQQALKERAEQGVTLTNPAAPAGGGDTH
ncbi:MAG TPA: protein-export chaperone SecB [Gammaproteobacteria bacterium]|nr:protein-export chaperone SecB [Gammaproteobacteria bacterium]